MNEQTFNVGDYVETNTGDRGVIQTIELNLTNGQYIANVAFDGGTNIHWLIRDLTLVTKAGDYGTMDTHLLDSIPEADVFTNGGVLLLDEYDPDADYEPGDDDPTEGWDVSLTRPPQDMVEAWQEAVAFGVTTLGLHEWLATQAGIEEGPAGMADYEVSISNTFAAEDEQHAVALFIEWLTETGLTYTVREDYGDGEWGEPYYVETGDTEVEAVKVFGPDGLLAMGSPTPWLPGDED